VTAKKAEEPVRSCTLHFHMALSRGLDAPASARARAAVTPRALRRRPLVSPKPQYARSTPPVPSSTLEYPRVPSITYRQVQSDRSAMPPRLRFGGLWAGGAEGARPSRVSHVACRLSCDAIAAGSCPLLRRRPYAVGCRARDVRTCCMLRVVCCPLHVACCMLHAATSCARSRSQRDRTRARAHTHKRSHRGSTR
jgi:hypothetical protein